MVEILLITSALDCSVFESQPNEAYFLNRYMRLLRTSIPKGRAAQILSVPQMKITYLAKRMI